MALAVDHYEILPRDMKGRNLKESPVKTDDILQHYVYHHHNC